MVYIVGSELTVPGATNEDGSERKHLVVLGTYQLKEEAKAAVQGLAPAVINGQYDQLSIFSVEEENKLYTFSKKELQSSYDELMKQQSSPYLYQPQVNVVQGSTVTPVESPSSLAAMKQIPPSSFSLQKNESEFAKQIPPSQEQRVQGIAPSTGTFTGQSGQHVPLQ